MAQLATPPPAVEPDLIHYAKESIVLSHAEANSALRKALDNHNYELAKKLATLLSHSAAPSNPFTNDSEPLVTIEPGWAHTLFKPLGRQVRDAGQPYTLIEEGAPGGPFQATAEKIIQIGGNVMRLAPEDPDIPPGDEEPPGDPGDPGGPGGTSLAAWEASFSRPRDLLLAIPPGDIVGSHGYPHIRAQIKWRNHSMRFWKAYYGSTHVNTQFGSGSIDWLKVWYEQTHQESYRNATLFTLGMGGDYGFQNHGGANPNTGDGYNGPMPLTVEQLPQFFDIWNQNNPKPMPAFVSETFIGEEYREEFGSQYPPPDPQATEWFLRWLGALGIDWDSTLHPLLNSAPYMWAVANFSSGNIPPGGIAPPPGFLPPLIGREGQTAGQILADYNALRFDIRRRRANKELAESIVASYAGAAGVANFNSKFLNFQRGQLNLMKAAGVGSGALLEYRNQMAAFVASEICSSTTCSGLLSDVKELIYTYAGERLIAEFSSTVEPKVEEFPWLADALIRIRAMPQDVAIETIAAMQDIEGWPPDGVGDFNGMLLLKSYWLSNGTSGVLFEDVLVFGGEPYGFVRFLRNFFLDTDRWEDYIGGPNPDIPPGGPGDPTAAELREVFPALNELDGVTDDDEMSGYDPSWGGFFSTMKAVLEARLKQKLLEDPSLASGDKATLEALFKELAKQVAFDIFKDYLVTQGIDPNHPAASHVVGLVFGGVWEGILDGVLQGQGAAGFFAKFEGTLATKLGTTPEQLTQYGARWGKLIGRGNLATTVAEIANSGVQIYSEWLQYSMDEITRELVGGLYHWIGPHSGRKISVAQYHYERTTGRSSWNIHPHVLSTWAAGQGENGFSGPVTVQYDHGPPPPTNGYDGVGGIWTYSRVYPSRGLVPGEPELNGGLPDLVIQNASVAATIVGNDLRLTFSGTVKNLGTSRADASAVQFYWTLSNGASGRFGGFGKWVGAIDPGQGRSFTQSLTEPNYLTLVPGTYHVHYRADDDDRIFELDEGNNNSHSLFVIDIP